MKRVIIADDDFIVRTYLKQMLAWEDEGYFLLADAKNGKEALNICQTEHPDIIITDMSMPVMNGMDLIRALKQTPSLQSIAIIVLSCHDDFTYVKEALKLGADDYLLKNDLTPELLLETLHKLKLSAPSSHDTESCLPNNHPNNISTEELALIGQRKLLNDFFTSFNSTQATDMDTLLSQAKRAGITVNFAMSSCMLIRLKDWQRRLQLFSHSDILSFNQAFSEMCTNIFKNNTDAAKQITHYSFHLNQDSKYWGILIDFAQENSKAAINQYLQIIADKIHTFVLRYFDLNTICYISAVQKNLLALKEHWHKLYELNDYSFYQESPVIFAADSYCLNEQVPPIITHSADELLEVMGSSTNNDNAVFIEVLQKFFHALYTEKLSLKCLQQITYDLEVKLKHRWQVDWTEIKNFTIFKEQFSNYLNKLRANKEIEHPAVRMALSYIENNYREPISQQMVADYVHLNPAYFSTLFKKYMDITFSDYVINYRLEKVKKRLLNSPDKIKDIAFAEGFTDYQYFCKLFKRIVGTSPSEYRSEH